MPRTGQKCRACWLAQPDREGSGRRGRHEACVSDEGGTSMSFDCEMFLIDIFEFQANDRYDQRGGKYE